MIVGLDLVRVQDVAAAIARFGARYIERVFTPAEAAYCGAAPGTLAFQRYASRVAAKEAARKVLRPGDEPDAPGIGWRDVEVCHAPGGGPVLHLHGAAAARAVALGLGALAVSLTHETEWAAAVVATVQLPASQPSLP